MRRFPHFYVIAHCHPSLIPSFVQIGSGFGRVIAEKTSCRPSEGECSICRSSSLK